jgi:hypothetical protein
VTTRPTNARKGATKVGLARLGQYLLCGTATLLRWGLIPSPQNLLGNRDPSSTAAEPLSLTVSVGETINETSGPCILISFPIHRWRRVLEA